MTGLSPITPPPSAALDIVKLDGLIPVSKEFYLRRRAVDRRRGAFYVGVRSVSCVLVRFGALEEQVHMQKRGWIG